MIQHTCTCLCMYFNDAMIMTELGCFTVCVALLMLRNPMQWFICLSILENVAYILLIFLKVDMIYVSILLLKTKKALLTQTLGLSVCCVCYQDCDEMARLGKTASSDLNTPYKDLSKH